MTAPVTARPRQGITGLTQHRQQPGVRVLVGGGHQSAAGRAERGSVDAGHDTAGGAAQGDTGREVHARGEVTAVGDVRGAFPGGDRWSRRGVGSGR